MKGRIMLAMTAALLSASGVLAATVQQWTFNSANDTQTSVQGMDITTWVNAAPNSVPSAGRLKWATGGNSDVRTLNLDVSQPGNKLFTVTVDLSEVWLKNNGSTSSDRLYFRFQSDAGNLELAFRTWAGSNPLIVETKDGVTTTHHSILTEDQHANSGPLHVTAIWNFEADTITLSTSGAASYSSAYASTNLANVTSINWFRTAGTVSNGSYLTMDNVTLESRATTPFVGWLIGHGLDSNLPPEADSGVDGLSLLAAYALNLDPHATISPALEHQLTGNALEIAYFSMAPWVRYEPRASVNLRDWTTNGVTVAGPDPEGMSSAGISLLPGAGFLKLRAEYPVLYVSPAGSGMSFTRSSPGAVSDALIAAPPGSKIVLLPGAYPRIDVNVSGVPERPITLVSDSQNPDQYAVIDGGNTTGAKGNQGMRISDASWLVIENLKFQNCWHNIIELDNSSYITVRGCDFKEGKEVVHAKAGAHHVLMEYNTWKQREEIWYEWSWADVHHSESNDLQHYSGSFYGGPWVDPQGYGATVIRHNKASHLFNWLAMWSSAPNLQANIEVYGNRVDYVRDNVIEPERFTVNLHVYHNEFNQCGSGMFSLLHNEHVEHDDPSMALNGPMYVYGNVGAWDPSDPVGGPSTYAPSYAVVKNCKWFTGEPVFFCHNSWKYNRFGLPNVVDNDRQMRHFNNIGVYDEGYSIQWAMQFEEWGNAFDYDFSDKAWQTHLLNKGQEANGIVAPDPGWTDPANSDYRLQPGSVCIDAGKVIPGFTQSYDGAAPDIGAYEGDKLVEGPPFYIRVPPSLKAATPVVVEQWDFSGANPETGDNGTAISAWTTASPNSVPSAGVLRYADTTDSDWANSQLLPDIDTSAIDKMIWTIKLADLKVSDGSVFRFTTLTSAGGDVRPELELTSWGAGPDYTFSPDMEYNGNTDALGGSNIALTGSQLGGPLTIVATWDFVDNTMTLQVGDNAPVSITPTANMADTIGTITGFRMYPRNIVAGDYLDLDSVTIETVTAAAGELGYVEKPRITRHRAAGNQLTLFWSWPLDPSSVQNDQIVVTADGRAVKVIGHSMASPYRELILTTDGDLEGAALDIEFKTFPTGDNGETATLWGSTL